MAFSYCSSQVYVSISCSLILVCIMFRFTGYATVVFPNCNLTGFVQWFTSTDGSVQLLFINGVPVNPRHAIINWHPDVPIDVGDDEF